MPEPSPGLPEQIRVFSSGDQPALSPVSTPVEVLDANDWERRETPLDQAMTSGKSIHNQCVGACTSAGEMKGGGAHNAIDSVAWLQEQVGEDWGKPNFPAKVMKAHDTLVIVYTRLSISADVLACVNRSPSLKQSLPVGRTPEQPLVVQP